VRLVSQIRAVRSEMNVSPGAKVPMLLKDAGETSQVRLDSHKGILSTLARLSSVELLEGEAPKGAVQDVLDEAIIVLPLADIIDIAAEQARLEKEIARLEGEITRHEKKLANKGFTDKAPPEVVETERQRCDEAATTLEKVTEALEKLKAL
jgi:valyl-tRNA synthetase